MLSPHTLLKSGDSARIWQKYCGFLDLTLEEFMEIQDQLLIEQIDIVHKSPLALRFMPKKPATIDEFRNTVPMTTFNDYADCLNEKNESVLADKPFCWSHTSGRGGAFKWVPYTEKTVEQYSQHSMAMMILACAEEKGQVKIRWGFKSLQNTPPDPYLSGVMAKIISPLIGANPIPPIGKYDDCDFQTRTQIGFQMALHTNLDILGSLTSVLIKIGEQITENSKSKSFNKQMLNPKLLTRFIKAYIKSKREGRSILPKDLWSVKGILCYGTDTSIYRDQLIHYWGKEPFECYASTETGIIAMNSWKKKSMTFTPYSCFLEFIPEDEWLKTREDPHYKPSTVLLNEVQPGHRYEIVTTSFYGMPFLRYRVGDLIKIVSLEERETGINIPQMLFESRADDLIDIAGFTRIDEKTMWQAIVNTGIKFEDWSARKENESQYSVIRLYIEPKEAITASEVEEAIHKELSKINRNYKDLEDMLGIRPLRVLCLPAGSFQRYMQKKQDEGVDLAHLKPSHINASDNIIKTLLNID